MLIALWIVNVLLALAFLGAGSLKIIRGKEQLQQSGMAWTEDFPAAMIKTIGTLEILGALGLILPLATDIAPILTPIAAVGLLITMAGAIFTHTRRHEAATPPIALAVLSIISAVLGFIVVL
ncbi:MAG: DoxX family protein [Ancrocorticia sp.]|uniref:DoxX family protein n=1 Tax=Ancrocorticia sp. TaxID=2593684 RepID=UPI003F8F5F5B